MARALEAAYPIFPIGNDRFFFKIVDAELQFARDGDGRVTAVGLHQGGRAWPPAVKRVK